MTASFPPCFLPLLQVRFGQEGICDAGTEWQGRKETLDPGEIQVTQGDARKGRKCF